MRFIHVADTHLGMQPDRGFPWSEERADALWKSFSHLIGVCRDEKPELLLIAGDLFHKSPLVRELKEVSALFASCPETRVVLIAGNHDYISGASNYNGFEWPDNVTFLRDEQVSSVFFEDIGVRVYGLSYRHRQLRKALYDGIRPDDSSVINILMLHGGEPDCLPYDKKALSGAGFDYIACGHLHTPLDISEKMRYPGCLEPLEKNDTGIHGYIAGSIAKDKSLETRFVPFASVRYYKCDIAVTPDMTEAGAEAALEDCMTDNGRDNIYSFRLTGRRDPDLCFDTVRLQKLGRILEVGDDTRPDYDFDALKRDNGNNIIGHYIDRLSVCGEDAAVREKALYYGIAALLNKDREQL